MERKGTGLENVQNHENPDLPMGRTVTPEEISREKGNNRKRKISSKTKETDRRNKWMQNSFELASEQ